MKRTRSAGSTSDPFSGKGLTPLGGIDLGSDEPVYIVWHHASWCPMACKVMKSERRARDEAGKLEALCHPYIVRSLGVIAPNLLLMPFLEGVRLSDKIDDRTAKPISISDALRLAIHVGSALAHVHARGYLHLDVKPDNVMIVAGGRPVLFDFGTARLQAAKRPQRVCGTDAYIAPEECSLQHAGPAADVFSLGVVLYETLTRELPFGRPGRAVPFPQLRREAVPPRMRRPAIPAALENLLMACLERNAAFRPTIDELLPALNAQIRHGPRMWPDEMLAGTAKRTAAMKRLPANLGFSPRQEEKAERC